MIKLFFLAGIFLLWLLPVALIPFVSIAPYLHSLDLFQRISLSVGATIGLVLLWVIGMGTRAWSFAGKEFPSVSDKFWGIAIMFLFSLIPVHLGGNVVSALVKYLPNRDVSMILVVEDVSETERRIARTDLVLRCQSTGQAFHLTLARRHFSYMGLQKGEHVELFGRHNTFGVFVDEVKVSRVHTVPKTCSSFGSVQSRHSS